MWRMFANIYLYLLLTTFSNNWSQTTCCWGTMNSDFSQKSFIMLRMWRMFAYISIYLPFIFSIDEKRHVVEYDKLRFQPEMISNAVCEECLLLSLYIYRLFSQMVSQNMLLSTINSYFSEKSFVMLYVKNVCKYLFIFTPYFRNWWKTTYCWVW